MRAHETDRAFAAFGQARQIRYEMLRAQRLAETQRRGQNDQAHSCFVDSLSSHFDCPRLRWPRWLGPDDSLLPTGMRVPSGSGLPYRPGFSNSWYESSGRGPVRSDGWLL